MHRFFFSPLLTILLAALASPACAGCASTLLRSLWEPGYSLLDSSYYAETEGGILNTWTHKYYYTGLHPDSMSYDRKEGEATEIIRYFPDSTQISRQGLEVVRREWTSGDTLYIYEAYFSEGSYQYSDQSRITAAEIYSTEDEPSTGYRYDYRYYFSGDTLYHIYKSSNASTPDTSYYVDIKEGSCQLYENGQPTTLIEILATDSGYTQTWTDEDMIAIHFYRFPTETESLARLPRPKRLPSPGQRYDLLGRAFHP